MRLIQTIGTVAVFCIAACLLGQSVSAQSSVTIGVGDTILEVSGKTSPGAFVTISRDGSVIGTVVAGSDGAFSQTFAAQSPGLHQLSLSARTTTGETTDTVTMTVNIAEHVTTTVQVFLPSTLLVTDSSVERGQALEIRGETAPSSTVTIFVDNSDYTTATSDATGNWSARIATDALSAGQHTFFVRVTDSLGAQSYPTSPRDFSIGSGASVPPPMVVAPLPQPPFGPPAIPTITFPGTDDNLRQSCIVAKGHGDPNVQIELQDGNQAIGSVWSGASGEWSMTACFEPGEHSLRAKACFGQRCSAFSPVTGFTHSLDVAGRTLRIIADKYAFSVYTDDPVTIQTLVIGGQPPYETGMRWDGQTLETGRYPRDTLQFTHSYPDAGRYNITLDVRDLQGRTGRAHFSVLVKQRLPSLFGLLLVVLPALIIALLLLWHWWQYNSKPSSKA
jgi:hypothetical protein